MIIVKCDRCGKDANKWYNDFEQGKSVRSVPSKIMLTDGVDSENYNDIFTDEKDKSFELCRPCFEIIKDNICKLINKNRG